MIINRKASILLKNKAIAGKVLLLVGARRVGKTVLLKQYLEAQKEKCVFWNGEDFAIHDLLKRRSIQHYKNIIGDAKLLVIDEAQKIPEIGNVLKLMIDSLEHLKIVATGSSAFDIANAAGEPLTGRKNEITLFPVSETEFAEIEKPQSRFDNMSQRLIYGNLPELINVEDTKEKSEYLRELINSYLLKDILAFENLRNSSKLFDLLKLIALQIGKEVSIQELGRQLAMSKNTVERYLDILTKVFIIYRLNGFSRNLRKEIVKNSKWYFFDNGIRNGIIANFNELGYRDDVGTLWENYMMSERIKQNHYNGIVYNKYFWRTYDRQEIDLIEEKGGKLNAYEFKWNSDNFSVPSAWSVAYPDSEFNIITNKNYLDWLVI